MPAVIDVVVTAATFVIAFVVLYWAGKALLLSLTERSLESRGFNEGVVSLARSIATALILLGSVAIAATVAGFGTILVALSALGGAVVLAVGFAAQDLIANFVAGIFIVKDEPFTIGDIVEWDDNQGVVRDIQLRVTQLETYDNELVTVPNSELADSVVVNPSRNGLLRVSYDFGIGYDDDIGQARAALIEEAEQVPGALTEPEPSVAVTDLGDSAVVLTGRFWIDPAEHRPAAARTAYIEAGKERLDAEGIDMPYPHSQLTGSVTVDEQAKTTAA
ncbi:mechanosensitive ion channel protein MscS [Natrialba magadii ATCC 43099]|uniref:Mechanosensitive ion channel protein MscS n=1 Tax=Natrialba magadii (strain ATCC 43099 / DSM 3394 / CCM 3739 / CIP 104546 / IAM 13178 / JCM 8861 / NBRC 102185 / NCIMB 2190 / MS3) TaxID=547559 RepID=L9UP44_NATMM|nr:mechanosensitive ion channel family protein [Natrialba magadii]ELY26649.1 mechanosensitive ion channel protein MscS [Natrialba magadii ATCC 43099]